MNDSPGVPHSERRQSSYAHSMTPAAKHTTEHEYPAMTQATRAPPAEFDHDIEAILDEKIAKHIMDNQDALTKNVLLESRIAMLETTIEDFLSRRRAGQTPGSTPILGTGAGVGVTTGNGSEMLSPGRIEVDADDIARLNTDNAELKDVLKESIAISKKTQDQLDGDFVRQKDIETVTTTLQVVQKDLKKLKKSVRAEMAGHGTATNEKINDLMQRSGDLASSISQCIELAEHMRTAVNKDELVATLKTVTVEIQKMNEQYVDAAIKSQLLPKLESMTADLAPMQRQVEESSQAAAAAEEKAKAVEARQAELRDGLLTETARIVKANHDSMMTATEQLLSKELQALTADTGQKMTMTTDAMSSIITQMTENEKVNKKEHGELVTALKDYIDGKTAHTDQVAKEVVEHAVTQAKNVDEIVTRLDKTSQERLAGKADVETVNAQLVEAGRVFSTKLQDVAQTVGAIDKKLAQASTEQKEQLIQVAKATQAAQSAAVAIDQKATKTDDALTKVTETVQQQAAAVAGLGRQTNDVTTRVATAETNIGDIGKALAMQGDVSNKAVEQLAVQVKSVVADVEAIKETQTATVERVGEMESKMSALARALATIDDRLTTLSRSAVTKEEYHNHTSETHDRIAGVAATAQKAVHEATGKATEGINAVKAQVVGIHRDLMNRADETDEAARGLAETVRDNAIAAERATADAARAADSATKDLDGKTSGRMSEIIAVLDNVKRQAAKDIEQAMTITATQAEETAASLTKTNAAVGQTRQEMMERVDVVENEATTRLDAVNKQADVISKALAGLAGKVTDQAAETTTMVNEAAAEAAEAQAAIEDHMNKVEMAHGRALAQIQEVTDNHRDVLTKFEEKCKTCNQSIAALAKQVTNVDNTTQRSLKALEDAAEAATIEHDDSIRGLQDSIRLQMTHMLQTHVDEETRANSATRVDLTKQLAEMGDDFAQSLTQSVQKADDHINKVAAELATTTADVQRIPQLVDSKMEAVAEKLRKASNSAEIAQMKSAIETTLQAVEDTRGHTETRCSEIESKIVRSHDTMARADDLIGRLDRDLDAVKNQVSGTAKTLDTTKAKVTDNNAHLQAAVKVLASHDAAICEASAEVLALAGGSPVTDGARSVIAPMAAFHKRGGDGERAQIRSLRVALGQTTSQMPIPSAMSYSDSPAATRSPSLGQGDLNSMLTPPAPARGSRRMSRASVLGDISEEDKEILSRLARSTDC